jgi:hypothetical protein
MIRPEVTKQVPQGSIGMPAVPNKPAVISLEARKPEPVMIPSGTKKSEESPKPAVAVANKPAIISSDPKTRDENIKPLTAATSSPTAVQDKVGPAAPSPKPVSQGPVVAWDESTASKRAKLDHVIEKEQQHYAERKTQLDDVLGSKPLCTFAKKLLCIHILV